MIRFYYHPTPNPAKVALFLEETGLRELPQPVDRKGDVPIFLKPGAVEIDRDVAAQKVFWPRRRGDSVIMRVAAAERVLATYDEPG